MCIILEENDKKNSETPLLNLNIWVILLTNTETKMTSLAELIKEMWAAEQATHIFVDCASRVFVSCLLFEFPRQPANYLLLCQKSGRALAPLPCCDPRGHVCPVLSNTMSMINPQPGTSRAHHSLSSSENTQPSLRMQHGDRMQQHKENILRRLLLKTEKKQRQCALDFITIFFWQIAWLLKRELY